MPYKYFALISESVFIRPLLDEERVARKRFFAYTESSLPKSGSSKTSPTTFKASHFACFFVLCEVFCAITLIVATIHVFRNKNTKRELGVFVSALGTRDNDYDYNNYTTAAAYAAAVS